jgi:RimJ/RimL family protein N-acetyltransferase|tara:strand:+ start:569 stop:1150 length:582 start_codon:yes stop_codon:yes gene_type:complete
MNKNNFIIQGQLVSFRYPNKNDAKGDWHLWMNDLDDLVMLGRMPLPISPEEQIAYMLKHEERTDRIIFMVCENVKNKIIGVASLGSINRYHQSAQSGILIGNKDFRNTKIAVEIMSLLTEYALIHLNLNRCDASALSNNPQSFLLNEFLGWTKVGIKKKSHFHKGEFIDSVLYEILKEDWLNSSKRPKTLKEK